VELKEIQVVCFLLVVLCLGATVAVGLLGMALWSVVLHILKAESRSREMVMSLSDDWRSYRRDEHNATMEPEDPPKAPDPPWRNPSAGDGFPEELLPPPPPGHMG